jgi:hypothetical protein
LRKPFTDSQIRDVVNLVLRSAARVVANTGPISLQ